MDTTSTIDPTAIQQQISALRAEFEEQRQKKEAAELRGREIDLAIRELQAKCPHVETVNHPVIDGPDAKFRDFCTACGAEVRPHMC